MPQTSPERANGRRRKTPDPASRAAEPRAASAVPTPEEERAILDVLTHGVLAWKALLEEKDWAGLAERIGLTECYVDGHPEDARTLVIRLEAATADLCDFDAVLAQVHRTEIRTDRARFSFRLKVLWSSADDWEDHDLDVDVHLGLERRGAGEWAATHLLLARVPAAAPPAAPEEPPPAPEPRAGAARSNGKPKGMPNGKPAPADAPLADTGFAATAAQYFTALEEGPQGLPGRRHVVYMPVIVDEKVLRSLFG